MVRKIIQVKGIVQGVGFRPFVYKKALQYALKGKVMNTSQGVIIDLEGDSSELEAFLEELTNNPPALAQISKILIEEKEALGYKEFEIVISDEGDSKDALVPPDVALCEDCKEDIFNKEARHYHYPFTNCTNCGPRFTIVKDIPYDRKQTTMKDFAMCEACKKEYENPLDRRFHAQPVACPSCGPQVTLVDKEGKEITLDEGNPFETFRRLIKEGNIIAIKGLGGFHLACNAKDEAALEKLRQRKNRPMKPFAVMARDLEVVRNYCYLSKEEEKVLTGSIAPIVILNRFQNLPENLAPNINTLGVMIPYTPLHFLLFDEEIDFLVMTSGNLSNLPLVKENEEALNQLGHIADYFLLHNREIHSRCDDSLVRLAGNQVKYWRRSRGAVPQALEVPESFGNLMGPAHVASGKQVTVLGTGSEMKNTFCLLKGSSAFMSQHIGELDSLEGIENYRESLANFSRLIDVKPQILGFDLHPSYQVSRLAQELPLAEKIPVQHHHAHMAACMAENGLDEEVIGVILDGTGYGLDNNLWGFEIFSGNYEAFTRQAHLDYVPLPGGERAIKNPWLTAVAYLISYLPKGKEIAKELFPAKAKEIDIAHRLIKERINTPLSSGCGRLFDAVSALLGVCRESTYEGQGAIELSEIIDPRVKESYTFSLEKKEAFVFSPKEIFQGLLLDLEDKRGKEYMATKFHNTIIKMVIAGVLETNKVTKLKKVVLSGGTWQNEYLLQEATKELREKGFEVYSHSKVPTNDGGLALGQALIAYRRWQKLCV